MAGSDISGADFLAMLKSDPVIRDAMEEGQVAHRVAYLVREMREAAGLAQSELAEKVGWPKARLVKIENASTPSRVSYAALNRITEACGFRMPANVAELPRLSDPKRS
ncbi:helix-turn-helix domain-containing protein [Parvularcula dongshanensis]|uniref:Ribosome-binding protein aMBF1 (Putative translation factor) n=1 Tax=Parvularcula dongshanensis TaxID=1173995 RepID=A0A840I8H6_9PROT|nr:helix-turn-helix transcriptional regulator [Parvularcula dongshanensis]MBB4660408.1 ribosome-binding protein aMBF1 (putative translation factor) [Parvularcula dongshanensis]